MRLPGLLLGALLCLTAGLHAAAQGVQETPWRGVRGDAQALSIASDGFTIAAGRDARLWAWRAADRAWSPLAGEGVRATALPGGRYYAILRNGELTFFDGLRVEPAGLRALDAAVAGDGAVYALRVDGALMRITPGARAWEPLGAVGGRRLAVAPDGSVWVALARGGGARWADGSLETLPGTVRELAVGADGTVLAIDREGALQRWNPVSRSWDAEPAPANLAAIALAPANVPWAATAGGAILTRAALAEPGVRIETAQTGGGITFGKSTSGRAGAPPRALRRGAFVALNPVTQVTDPAPFEWIDTQASAASLAIAGRDGSVFALDAGGLIGRWSNQQRRFTSYPGQLAKIAVEADGNPWGINSLGRIFRRDASDWRQILGAASDLSIGVNGHIFATTATGALFQYDRSADALVPLPGILFSVAVAPDGARWGLLQDGTVMRCPNANCQRFTRFARSIAVGPDASVFIVTLDGMLQRLTKAMNDWEVIPVLGQKLRSVAVGPRGRPWVVADSGRVYASAFFARDESTDLLEASTTSSQTVGSGAIAPVQSTVASGGFVFSKNLQFESISVPGGADGLSLGPSGAVVMFVGSTGLIRYNSSKKVFETVSGLPAGNIRHAKYGPDGTLWIISADIDGRIYHQTSGTNFETLQLPIASPQPPVANAMNRSVNIGPDGSVYAIDTVGTLWRRPAGSTTFAKLINGTFKNAAIPRSNDVWVIDNNKVVRQIVDGVAQRRPSNRDVLADDIAGGQDGSVYITTPVGANNHPAKWNANSQAWDQLSTIADVVGVAPDGRPWLFNSANPTVLLRAK
jgi:hypothetical protein